jgi:predicted nucleic acid-binding protein
MKKICIEDGCLAITLNCREDYTYAKSLWGRHSFQPLTEKPGKNKVGIRLLQWVWENSEAYDLFGYETSNITNKKIVVIDVNVLIKYRDETCDVVDYSLGDWLQGEIEIYYTPELLVELSRNDSVELRDATRKTLESFKKISVNEIKYNEALKHIINKLPTQKSEQDESDRKQLAYACSFGADYFVSFDDELVTTAQRISDEFNILIFKPEEFIVHLDEHLNLDAYNPSNIKNSNIIKTKITYDDVSNLENIFIQKSHSETKAIFTQKFKELIANYHSSSCYLLTFNDEPIAFLGYQAIESKLDVKFFRVLNNKYSTTLIMQLAEDLIKDAISIGVSCIELNDTYANFPKALLEKSGFLYTTDRWVRPIIIGSQTINSFLKSLVTSSLANSYLSEYVRKKISSPHLLEYSLHPFKFTDLDIPVYIVPIYKYWAMQMFDEVLASQDLFGSDPSLAFNVENVYYTASKLNIDYPARILWYVKSDKASPESGHIRATSYLDKVIKAGPKDLYREFKRLGVYKWEDVYKKANYDINNDITALLFSKSELLSKPISFHDIQQVQRNQIQGPVRISNELFMDIYLGRDIISKNTE